MYVPGFVTALSGLLADDPSLRLLQGGLILVAAIIVFLVLYTLRDSVYRSHSFWFQCFSILVVAGLPVFGFLLYLLFRPSATLRQRETDDMVRALHAHFFPPEAVSDVSNPDGKK